MEDNLLSVALSLCTLQLLPSCGTHTGSMKGAPGMHLPCDTDQEGKRVSPQWGPQQPSDSLKAGGEGSGRRRPQAWGTPQGRTLVPGYPRRAPAGSGTRQWLTLAEEDAPAPHGRYSVPGSPRPPPGPLSPTGSDRSRADVRTAKPSHQPSLTSGDTKHMPETLSLLKVQFFFSIYYIFFFQK